MWQTRYFQFLLLLIITGFLSGQHVLGQKRSSDTLKSFTFLQLSYIADLPGADMSQDYGWNSEIALAAIFKRKDGWMYGVEGSVIVGDKIKNDLSLFQNITTSDGYIIGSDGQIVKYRVFERGWKFPVVKVGKMFSKRLLKSSANSGFYVMGGVGYMQHKLKIQDVSRNFEQIKGDYIKGYDRLVGGVMLTQNVGYIYYGKNKLTNFHIGLEFSQAFTRSRRSYNFDFKMPLTGNRLDLLYGVKLSWIIPLYSKMADGYYYY